MTNEEIAMCLSIINKNIDSISIIGNTINRNFTIINDIKMDNVAWVINEAIKALKEDEEK